MQLITVEILSPQSLKLLRELEELHIIRLISGKAVKEKKVKKENGFFLSAGIWKNREVNVESIRKDAWKRK